MITVTVKCSCGQSVDEGIRDCLEFSERCKCFVHCEMNSIHMTFLSNESFGKTIEERVAWYRNVFDKLLEERRRSHEESWNQ